MIIYMIHGKCGDAIFLKGRTSIDPRHALERCQCVNATPLSRDRDARGCRENARGVKVAPSATGKICRRWS